MKFSDILALAKKGYSPKDIKDLMALEDPEEPDKQEPDQKQKPDKPDDKDTKIIELEKKIAELQKLNTTKDISDKKPKSDDDIFNELMREFM